MFCDSCFTYCYYVKLCFSSIQEMLKVIYGIRIVIYFCEVFQCYAFSLYHNIWMKKFFQGHSYFLGVALLNWFTKSSKFEEGFNDNELSLSCSRSLHCVMLLSVFLQQARKFLLFDKESKGKIVLQYQDSSQFWRYL